MNPENFCAGAPERTPGHASAACLTTPACDGVPAGCDCLDALLDRVADAQRDGRAADIEDWSAALGDICRRYATPPRPAGLLDPVLGLNPEMPVVKGPYQMTREWRFSLPAAMHQRVEDGRLVFWRAGLTVWITIWENDPDAARRRRSGAPADAAPHSPQMCLSHEVRGDAGRRATEPGGKILAAVVADAERLQVSAEFDTEPMRACAYALLHSMRYVC